MSASTELDALIEELQRARAEGATWVCLQVNDPGTHSFREACVQFGWHDSNTSGRYVIGGDLLSWESV